MKILVTLSLALIGGTGCTHVATFQKAGNIGSNKAVAFARMKIVKDGEDFSQYSNLIVTAAGHNSYAGAYQHPGIKDGVFCIRLPVGQYHFFHIRACKGLFRPEYGYDFKTNQVTFALPEANRAYYLGDITINWKPKSSNRQMEAAIAGAGLVVAALMPKATSGEMSLDVQDNLAQAQTLFRSQLQTDKELVPALLKVEMPNPQVTPSAKP